MWRGVLFVVLIWQYWTPRGHTQFMPIYESKRILLGGRGGAFAFYQYIKNWRFWVLISNPTFAFINRRKLGVNPERKMIRKRLAASIWSDPHGNQTVKCIFVW